MAIDLSNRQDVQNNLDSTTQKSFGIGANVDWYTQGDEIFITFGKNTQSGNTDNVPAIKINNTGQIMTKFFNGQFQYLGAVTGSNHPPNEDTGTTYRTFTIDSDLDSNSSSAAIEMIFGRASNTGSYAAIRNYQGNLQWRNHGGTWASLGVGGGEGHTQNTDTGTNVSTFSIDSDEASNSATVKELLFGNSTGSNKTGFRNYNGTMQYKNYSDADWTAVGSGSGGHTQNTDTGTTATTFVIASSQVYGTGAQVLRFSSTAGDNEVALRNNAGNIEYHD